MKLLKNILIIILSIVVILIIGFAVFKGVFFLFKYLDSLQKEVAASIIAGSTTIIVSVISITLAKYKENKRSIEFEIRGKKIPVYVEFINFIMKILSQDKIGGKKMNEESITKFFMEFTEKLLIWGSDEVIKNYTRYKAKMLSTSTEKNEKGDVSSLFILEELLLAIRKDTGHKNKNMKTGDILRLFINDIDEYI